jgi:transposase
MNKTIKHVAFDVHALSYAVAIASPDGEVRDYGIIGGKLSDVDRILPKLQTSPNVELRFVYEAGPTGFGLARHLRSKGYVCEIVSPSLVPQRASDRIKTDRRDARNLARLFRAGELTFIHVPDPADEAVRDVVRLRQSAVRDQRQARQRLKGYLLRNGHRYTGKTSWGPSHLNYLSRLKLPLPAQQFVLESHIQQIQALTERLELLNKAVENQLAGWRWEPLVRALMTFRGIALLNAMTLVSEIGDFLRFDNAPGFMKFVGLVPSENTTGDRRVQGGITKAGNTHCRRALVEAAWHYRIAARVSPSLRLRQHGQPKEVTTLSWKAQQRLCSRFQHLRSQHKQGVVVVTAIARELAGFVWAMARLVARPADPSSQTQTKATKAYSLKPARKFQPKKSQ